ncbi:MAG TPA: hypothetical protein VGF07_07315 [Stellaceae bacterium]
MRGTLMIAAAVGGLVFAGAPARSAVVDTFAVTQSGWAATEITAEGLTLGAADPGGILTGTFTATVEPNGLILLADLTAFSDSYSDSAAKGILSVGLADLTSFFYDPTEGSGSLQVAGTFGKDQTCEGNAVQNTPDCSGDESIIYAAGIDGAIFRAGLPLPSLLTIDAPEITLVSSTPAPVVPEPPSLPLLAALAGFCVFACPGHAKDAV